MAEITMKKVEFNVTAAVQFDLKHFYSMLHEWLLANKWTSMSGDIGAEKSEILYKQEEKTGGITEHKIWWRVKKTPIYSKEFEYIMNIDISTTAMAKKEISYGKIVDSGEIGVDISCSLKFLPEDEWTKTDFQKSMLYFYKMWKAKMIEKAESEMYSEVYKFQAHIKSYLNLRQFISAPEAELFHPAKIYPKGG